MTSLKTPILLFVFSSVAEAGSLSQHICAEYRGEIVTLTPANTLAKAELSLLNTTNVDICIIGDNVPLEEHQPPDIVHTLAFVKELKEQFPKMALIDCSNSVQAFAQAGSLHCEPENVGKTVAEIMNKIIAERSP